MVTKRFELTPLGGPSLIRKVAKVAHHNFPLSVVREQRSGAGWKKGGFGILGVSSALIAKNYQPNQKKDAPKKKEPRYSVKAANIRWLANVARWPYVRIVAEFGVTRSAVENAMRSSSEVCIKPEQWDDEKNTLKGPFAPPPPTK